MLKKYGQPVPEQQPMSSLEEAQAAKAKLEAEKAKDGHTHFHDGHACTQDHGHGEADHNHSSGTLGTNGHAHQEQIRVRNDGLLYPNLNGDCREGLRGRMSCPTTESQQRQNYTSHSSHLYLP